MSILYKSLDKNANEFDKKNINTHMNGKYNFEFYFYKIMYIRIVQILIDINYRF
jgi:hypothetical protein